MKSIETAAASGGNATRIRIDVIKMFHVNSGIRHIVMPGARSMNTVAIRFTAVMIEAMLVSSTPMIHMSMPGPGLPVGPDSGAYAVHPTAAAPCEAPNDDRMV